MRYQITQTVGISRLTAEEPCAAEVGAAATAFAAWYSEPYNRRMMDGQPMMPSDVLDCFERARADGGRIFYLYCDGDLVGDADFRHVRPPAAEFAIMVGARQIQGRGLGTHFTRMLHHLAFEKLGLERVFLTVLPLNMPARRCYEKIGYVLDESEAACAYREEETDVPMSLSREAFYSRNSHLLDGMQIEVAS